MKAGTAGLTDEWMTELINRYCAHIHVVGLHAHEPAKCHSPLEPLHGYRPKFAWLLHRDIVMFIPTQAYSCIAKE